MRKPQCNKAESEITLGHIIHSHGNTDVNERGRGEGEGEGGGEVSTIGSTAHPFTYPLTYLIKK